MSKLAVSGADATTLNILLVGLLHSFPLEHELWLRMGPCRLALILNFGTVDPCFAFVVPLEGYLVF